MKYDFTSMIDRRGMDAIAVDGLGDGTGMAPAKPKDGFDVIPMWVADMNFATVPTIPEAIINRAKHPLYGYFLPRDEYYQSIIQWQEKRNHVTGLAKECIGYENGVLGCVVSALTAFASPGDEVLLHSPTYIGFTNSLTNNGFRKAERAPHPCGCFLQSAQSLRACVGALGAGKSHGDLPEK